MEDGAFRHIGCCIDETPAADAAIALARDLWTPGEGALSIVHVSPRPLIMETVGGAEVPSPRDIATADRTWLRARAAAVPGAEAVALEGGAGPAICRWAAGAGVDLLVVARHHGPIDSAVRGSVARHLVDHAPCPVLVVRHDAAGATAGMEGVP